MELREQILLALLIGFFALALLRIFRAPLRLVGKVLVNTALGFAALWAAGALVPAAGLGLNLGNALVIGVLGLPGFVLLLLLGWVL